VNFDEKKAFTLRGCFFCFLRCEIIKDSQVKRYNWRQRFRKAFVFEELKVFKLYFRIDKIALQKKNMVHKKWLSVYY
jgi:hypothetical protein